MKELLECQAPGGYVWMPTVMSVTSARNRSRCTNVHVRTPDNREDHGWPYVDYCPGRSVAFKQRCQAIAKHHKFLDSMTTFSVLALLN